MVVTLVAVAVFLVISWSLAALNIDADPRPLAWAFVLIWLSLAAGMLIGTLYGDA